MKNTTLFFWVVLFFLLTISGCGKEPDTDNSVKNVKVGVVFGKVGSVEVYDETGNVVESSIDGDLSLNDGKYYAKIQDTDGNETFESDGKLMFLPTINNTPANTDPKSVSWSETPVVEFIVDNGNVDHKVFTSNNASNDVNQKIYDATVTGARARVLWEIALAMIGPINTDNYSWVTTQDEYSKYPYVSSIDPVAWSTARKALGINTSCKDSVNGNYSPCKLNYGAENVLTYVDQNKNFLDPAIVGSKISCQGKYRGGQCKTFVNLVLYRSLVYRNSNGTFKILPSDATVTLKPLVTPESIQAGDVLRMPGGHGLFVVKIITKTADTITKKIINAKVVVVDSNWLGGNGCEQVGSHLMSFDIAKTGVSNLKNYNKLDCVYDGQC